MMDSVWFGHILQDLNTGIALINALELKLALNEKVIIFFFFFFPKGFYMALLL